MEDKKGEEEERTHQVRIVMSSEAEASRVKWACVPQDAKPGHQLGGKTQGELVSKSTVPD
eukprot:SAG22_NODE_9184_length_604_cov_1.283168_2_plen_59_part_01